MFSGRLTRSRWDQAQAKPLPEDALHLPARWVSRLPRTLTRLH